jgi:integrase
MKYNELKIRIKKLINEYVQPLEIKELDLDIIPTLKSQKTGEAFSTPYRKEMQRIGRYFNSFLCEKQSGMSFLDILNEFLRSRSGKISEHTYYIQANALKGLIMNQPKIQRQNEYFKQIFETVVKDICFDQDLLDNCLDGVSRGEPNPLNKEQLMLLLDAANKRTSLIVSFILITGSNVQELVRITLKEVMQLSYDDAVTVILASNSKNQRSAVIPSSMLLTILNEFHGTNHIDEIPKDRFLFQTRTGKALKKNNVYIMIENAGQKIGIDKLNVADLYENSRMIKRMGGCSNIVISHSGDVDNTDSDDRNKVRSLLNCFSFLNEFYDNQNN